ncbi:MAG: ATP-binding protein [Bacteroidales bacterium]|nr:ATP-binding protein [Bacteroidales bacterium]
MEKKLIISSKIDNLREVEKAIDEISSEFNFKEEKYGNILIAALEATNNAILHGNKLEEEKDVEVLFKIEENLFSIKVKDQGIGFDYENIPDPTAPENIENVSGRGIFLMEKLSDKIKFEENGSVVELEFNIA